MEIPVLDFRCESVGILPLGEGLIFTAQGSARFPVGAALVQPLEQSGLARSLHYPKHERIEPKAPRRHVDVPWLKKNPTGAVVVLNPKALSGMPVEVGVAEEGARMFTDREWRFKGLPRSIPGLKTNQVYFAHSDSNLSTASTVVTPW